MEALFLAAKFIVDHVWLFFIIFFTAMCLSHFFPRVIKNEKAKNKAMAAASVVQGLILIVLFPCYLLVGLMTETGRLYIIIGLFFVAMGVIKIRGAIKLFQNRKKK